MCDSWFEVLCAPSRALVFRRLAFAAAKGLAEL
jgi:hypothetical protein